MSEKKVGAFLQITMKINDADRASAAGVYTKYRAPFLNDIAGAVSKQLLLRTEDAQVLHGFETVAAAEAYLQTDLFKNDVVVGLTPFLQEAPEVRIFEVVA